MPVLPWQHDAEMRHRHIVSIHGIAVTCVGPLDPVDHVRNHLMTEEVVVDPSITASSLRTPEQLAVEGPGRGEIMHREGEMER